ncbi:MAG TPA: hypothetical protein DCS07_16420 [Bdellovibrionales bacterium]|nr:MAG: hypothetical protein A2X97_12225 [Bdellovibrionales bacterium GWA1_52_35]OFZ39765.1 MAG: hypothetical protein A2070_01075 [Bdellovibrionales bacterium GWC1_52_8]HAR44190.1 hypothetical protein [Bdellovibrionales bacterium]HCM41600.1 hypothetical protein [Bdellovibrionales bacterium]
MKNVSSVFVICISLFGLTACNTYYTPKGVIKTAGKALMANDVKLFRSTLTADMAVQYGNASEMANLRSVIAPFEKFEISKESVLNSKQHVYRVCNSAGWHTIQEVDVQRTSEVQISGKTDAGVSKPLWIATVDCDIYYAETSRYKGGLCYERNGAYCQISALK